MTAEIFQLTRYDNQVAVIEINLPGEKVNTLQAEFADQLRELIAEARRPKELRGLVFISAKADNFIAGADLKMIEACETSQQAEALAQAGQKMFAEIAALPFPVIAAIHGSCLGGGLEFALACSMRICSDDPATQFALPEVRLGLLPGSGGTQRLPQLIGLANALPMLLAGKHLNSQAALKFGLVDQVVPRQQLLSQALQGITQASGLSRKLTIKARLLQAPGIRTLLLKQAAKRLYAQTRGNYPAPNRILHLLTTVTASGSEQGYQLEAKTFGELAMTPQSQALRALFFQSTALKKNSSESGGVLPPIRQLAVLGGGLMGAGIAAVSALETDARVRIKETSTSGIAHALGYYQRLVDKRIARRKIQSQARPQWLSKLTADYQWRGFANAELVIEAVYEELEVKRQMVAEVERHCSSETLFASNTSSLSITAIAQQARHPENIIGLHYFSPAEKMPLVEVVPQPKTSPQTLQRVLAFARAQGKTPIVVADKPGFYVNRILTPYLNEALRCLMEGEPIEHIDLALREFGFPIGPFQLLDEIGLDVAGKIAPLLHEAYGEPFAPVSEINSLLEKGWQGKKNRKGFYRYAHSRTSQKKVDKRIYDILKLTPQIKQSREQIAHRCVLLMLNEAMACLEEGVIRSAAEGDIGAVFGIGFPPFLGGPFRYIQQQGERTMHALLHQAEQNYGSRFAARLSASGDSLKP